MVHIRLMSIVALLICPLVGLASARSAWAMARDYQFDGAISQGVLENYLSRSIQYLGLCSEGSTGPAPYFEDTLRLIRSSKPKFIGRAAYAWDCPTDDEAHFRAAQENASAVHAIDPEIVLQACVFETAYEGVNKLSIPQWVFEEFGLKPEARNFRYRDMLYPDGRLIDQWGAGASVPDITRLETRLWFYYRARRYIDAGYEAIHFGQVQLVGQNDKGWVKWQDMLERCRTYAKSHARRHYVLFDGHFVMTRPDPGVLVGGKLLWDFIGFPLRPVEGSKPLEASLAAGHYDALYGRAPGGIHPSGWLCKAIPQLYEVDNCFAGLTSEAGGLWIWGTDEATWFANCPEDYRNRFLRYAYEWIWNNAEAGYFEMPGRRPAAVPVGEPQVWSYIANTRSASCPEGFGQEDAIKAVWDSPEFQDPAARVAAPATRQPEPLAGVGADLVADWRSDSSGALREASGSGLPVKVVGARTLEELQALYKAYGDFVGPEDQSEGQRALQKMQAAGGVRADESPVGQALHISGTSYLDFGDSPALASPSFTLAFWVKLDAMSDSFVLLDKYMWMSSGYYIKYDHPGRSLYAEVFDGGSTRRTVAFRGVKPGEWFNLAVTVDGQKLTAYVNGKQVRSVKCGPAVPNSLPLRIGVGCPGISVGDIVYYRRSLGPDEILSIAGPR